MPNNTRNTTPRHPAALFGIKELGPETLWHDFSCNAVANLVVERFVVHVAVVWQQAQAGNVAVPLISNFREKAL